MRKKNRRRREKEKKNKKKQKAREKGQRLFSKKQKRKGNKRNERTEMADFVCPKMKQKIVEKNPEGSIISKLAARKHQTTVHFH